MAHSQRPGPVCGVSGSTIDHGTSARILTHAPAPVGLRPYDAHGSRAEPVVVRRRVGREERSTRSGPADPDVIFISLDFIILNPIRTDYSAQLAEANFIFAPTQVQFFVEEIADIDPFMVNYVLRGRLDVDDVAPEMSNSRFAEVSRLCATMTAHVKVVFIRSVGDYRDAFAIREHSPENARDGIGRRIFISDGAMRHGDDSVLAHELTHILINRYDQDPSDHIEEPGNVMHTSVNQQGIEFTPPLPPGVTHRHLNAVQRRRVYAGARAICGLPPAPAGVGPRAAASPERNRRR